VLVLLALQASFLAPPLGYAVMMASARSHPAPGLRALARSLAPYLAAQWLVLALVLAWPRLTHPFAAPQAPPAPQLNSEELDRLLRAEPRESGER
jgi:TRAP-type mannitol/chloroaromatic compound transport system permease large subunit